MRPIACFILLLGIAGWAVLTHAEQVEDMSARIGDFTAAHAGKELAQPLIFGTTDSNFDGIPDSASIRFDVYPLGSSTRLYSSQSKAASFNFPTWATMYCTQQDFDAGEDPATSIRAGSRIVYVSGIDLNCYNFDTDYEYGKIIVFGANVSASNGSAWLFQAAGRLESTSGVDANGDGVVDQIAVEYDVLPTTSVSNSRVVILNAVTGAVISNVVVPSMR